MYVVEQRGGVYGTQINKEAGLANFSRSSLSIEQFSCLKHLGVESYHGHFLHILSAVLHGPGGKTLPFPMGLIP